MHATVVREFHIFPIQTPKRAEARAPLRNGARDLSRRSVSTAQTSPQHSKIPFANQSSYGLKSALRSEMGRGIYPAGARAPHRRACNVPKSPSLTNLPAG